MGYELTNMNSDELENLLYETSAQNDYNLDTFIQALYDNYGGIYTKAYEKLINFLHYDLRISSDADLRNISDENKQRIIQFMSSI